jgi:hypothetical protein
MMEEKLKLQNKLERQNAMVDLLEGPEANEVKEEIDEIEMRNFIISSIVQQEISERRQWMSEMISLGRGDVHKRQMQVEIRQVWFRAIYLLLETFSN